MTLTDAVPPKPPPIDNEVIVSPDVARTVALPDVVTCALSPMKASVVFVIVSHLSIRPSLLYLLGAAVIVPIPVMLVLLFASGFGSTAPMSQQVIGVSALGLWLFVPWAAWVDRHRSLASDSRSS